MKTTILKTLVLFLLITTLFSCGKDDGGSNPNNGNYYFTVKIDGVEHSFNKDLAGLNTTGVNAIQTVGVIGITHSDDNGNWMSIGFIPNDISVGAPTDDFLSSFKLDGQAGVWAPDHSTTRESKIMTILEDNGTYIEGTFSFTGRNAIDKTTKEFTEGRFKAKKK